MNQYESNANMSFKKLAIGTANFGMKYGTFNASGQINFKQVKLIAKLALERNLDTLDTAISYGESESVLGSIGVSKWKIVTKIPPITNNIQFVDEWLYSQVQESLLRLKVPKIHGLLLHAPSQLRQAHGHKIWSIMLDLKEKQIVSKIGYSIYNPSELDDLWKDFRPDIVQSPLNLIDRRLYTSGWLDKLHNNGCEVHARSIFLQGLLLSKNIRMPNFFKKWQPLFKLYYQWLEKENLTPLEACLSFALSFPKVSNTVVGVDSLAHLKQILDCGIRTTVDFPNDISTEDTNLINPANWQT